MYPNYKTLFTCIRICAYKNSIELGVMGHVNIILAIWSLGQEDFIFKASVGNLVKTCFKIKLKLGWGCVVQWQNACLALDLIPSTTNKQNQ